MSRYIDADLLDDIALQRGITRWEYKMIESVLFDFPSADVVEVVHGKWTDTETGKCKCSYCKTTYEIKAKFLYSYCPNCGARMDGAE